jgi:hypothetical protein
MSGHDDLDGWGDDAIVRALRAPGTAHELADRERYVAAFRASRTSRSNVSPLRRGVRRLGAGGTTVIAVVALSSGVAAAAYTRHLPEPVQRVAHDVLGAPAPRTTPERSPEAASPAVQTSAPTTSPTPRPAHVTAAPSPTSAAAPTPAPTEAPTPAPTATPTSAPTSAPTDAPPTTPTTTPTETPTASPTTPVPTAPLPAPEPASLSLSGSSHRATPGSSTTLSGSLSAADGTAVAAHDVVLQRRAPHRWLPVAVATADDSGAVSFATPPADATATYRLVGAPGVRSQVWRIVLVPVVTATSAAAGPEVDVTATVEGARPGDRVVLLRQGAHRLLPVGHSTVGGDGTATWRVAPARTSTYVVRLPATATHGLARAELTVTPPRPDALVIGADTHHTGWGASVTIRGEVRVAGGAPLPGEEVVLQVRGPQGWRPVGVATSDAFGGVAIPTPAAEQTAVYRLRAGPATSPSWRVALVPALSATVTTGTPYTDLAVSALGGRVGDAVVLLRRVDGALVPVLQATLDAAGAARFEVTPGQHPTRYVVRLPATAAHDAARVPVVIPPAAPLSRRR